MKMNAGRGTGIVCLILGVLLAAVGVAAIFNLTTLFRTILGKKVVLSSSSQGFPIWKDVSNHFDTKVAWYFFNLTNPDEFIEGKRPILKEVGPFWYKAVLMKRNITFNDNKTVTFQEHRRFDFIENSALPDTTEITMVNVPVMALFNKLDDMSYLTKMAVDAAISSLLNQQPLILKYTVKELTYSGKYSELVAFSKMKSEGILNVINSMSKNDSAGGLFGFGIDKNETKPSTFNMFTGATGVNDLNRIFAMEGQHILDIWPTEDKNVCNIVDGTFGYSTAPMNESKMQQRVYIPDMCRSVMIKYNKDNKLGLSDIRTRQFILSPESFESRKTRPENFCYDEQFGFPSGISEVGPCKQGAPILMSMPHFLHADPLFSQKVGGMTPDPEKHTFIMEHEPTTGMTVSVRARLQANVRIVPSDNWGGDYLPTNIIMPLFWQEVYVEGGPSIHAFLHKVLGYPGLAKIALIIAILIGLILAIIGTGLLISNRRVQSANLSTGKVGYSKAPTAEGGHVNTRPEASPLV